MKAIILLLGTLLAGCAYGVESGEPLSTDPGVWVLPVPSASGTAPITATTTFYPEGVEAGTDACILTSPTTCEEMDR